MLRVSGYWRSAFPFDPRDTHCYLSGSSHMLMFCVVPYYVEMRRVYRTGAQLYCIVFRMVCWYDSYFLAGSIGWG